MQKKHLQGDQCNGGNFNTTSRPCEQLHWRQFALTVSNRHFTSFSTAHKRFISLFLLLVGSVASMCLFFPFLQWLCSSNQPKQIHCFQHTLLQYLLYKTFSRVIFFSTWDINPCGVLDNFRLVKYINLYCSFPTVHPDSLVLLRLHQWPYSSNECLWFFFSLFIAIESRCRQYLTKNVQWDSMVW